MPKKHEIPYNAIYVRFGGIKPLSEKIGYKLNSRNFYKKAKIKKQLLKKFRKKGRLTAKEIQNDKDLPGISTIYRYFKTTKLKKVWSEVLKNEIKLKKRRSK